MKPHLYQLEPRDQPASAVLDASGTLYVVSEPGEVVTFTTLPVGDPLLPEYARLHPEQFVGTATLPFLVGTDANGVVFVGHEDAVSQVVYGAPPDPTTGATSTEPTTPTTPTTGTGGSTGEPQASSLKTSGKKAKGGGLYTSAGGIHVDHWHHTKHVKHHSKHIKH